MWAVRRAAGDVAACRGERSSSFVTSGLLAGKLGVPGMGGCRGVNVDTDEQ